MSIAIDKFAELETRIMRAVELVKVSRQEKEAAEKELSSVRTQMAKLERELEELRGERDVVKNRVESLLDSLSELTEETLA